MKKVKVLDIIKVGDLFDAYLKKSRHSVTLLGKEAAGRRSFTCPEVATGVSYRRICTKKSVYERELWRFEKVKGDGK